MKRGKNKTIDDGHGDDNPPVEPERPICKRTWIDDITTEAVVTKLQDNPRGLLVASDELSGWLDFDRYSKGKGGSEVARWLQVYGGRELIVDRKTSDTEYVPRASVSIAGGIQPEVLKRSLTQLNQANGLTARLLFTFPPRRAKKWTDDNINEGVENKVEKVFESLYALEPELDADGEHVPRRIPLDRKGKKAFKEFVDRHGNETVELFGNEAAAWCKLEGYCARFALIIHLLRVVTNDSTLEDENLIDHKSIEAGVTLVEWFGAESRRVYAMLTENEIDRLQRDLLDYIRRNGGSVTPRKLVQGMTMYRGKTDQAKHDLGRLAELGYGSWVNDSSGSKGGRPSSKFQLKTTSPSTKP